MPHISATQRALACFDVLALIFGDNVWIPHEDTASKPKSLRMSDLISAALVCRAWRTPALRFVWRDLPSSLPLWNLFTPPDIRLYTHGDLSSGVLDKIISSQLWTSARCSERFSWYSGHIRTLRVNHAQDVQFFRTVLEKIDSVPILPSLKTLWWSPRPVSDQSLLPLFRMSLRNIFLNYSKDFKVEASTLHAIVSRLREHSPALDSICIDAVLSTDDPTLCTVADTIASFRNISRIRITDSVSLSSFYALVANPCLADIEIGVSRDKPTKAHDLVTAPGLRRMVISGRGRCLTKLFSSIRTPRLQHANITAWDRSASVAPDYVSCISAFAAALNQEVLEWVHLELGCSSEPATDDVIQLIKLIEPLLPCGQLKHFYLACHIINIATIDDEFERLSMSWPALEYLHVDIVDFTYDPGEDPEMEAAPTLAVLFYLWHHCPRLLELSLPYLGLCEWMASWLQVTSLRETVGDNPSTHPLAVLRIAMPEATYGEPSYCIEMNDEALSICARYLTTMFPVLDVDRCRPLDAESVELCAWAQVFRYMLASS
ncbi:hypothetical protein C8Q80DRAFT_1273245 [Daedaleopsis nitida]|nr:hypothetical protein C8Q80DRAFT_1273245 [Daedaleopsis nitida]